MSGSPIPSIVRTFSLPRRASSRDEIEDYADYRTDQGRFALADGAAESYQGGLWAQLLVEDFLQAQDPLDHNWTGRLHHLQRRWAERVGLQHIQEQSSLPWYLEPQVRTGAFATFLGVTIGPEGWNALAVGDSCLFHTRGDRLLEHFPIVQALDFTSSPWLIGSRTSPEEVPRKQAHRRQGMLLPGDRLWLMTDALAHWFLARWEAREHPWRELERFLDDPIFLAQESKVESQGQTSPLEFVEHVFADWVSRLRTSGALRNDDTTLLALGF